MTAQQRTVWTVETGQYSDYRVVGVFSCKENAEFVAAEIGGKANLVERPIDPGVAELHQGLKQYIVLMRRDVTVERCYQQETNANTLSGEFEIWRRAPKGKGVYDVIGATVWASDEQHAVKIVNEKRAQMIATGEWDESVRSESR